MTFLFLALFFARRVLISPQDRPCWGVVSRAEPLIGLFPMANSHRLSSEFFALSNFFLFSLFLLDSN